MPSHSEPCLSANRFGPREDFDCICPTEPPAPPRSAAVLLDEVIQIAFTEGLLPGHAIGRIRELIDPERATCLRGSDDADIALVPLRDRIEIRCQERSRLDSDADVFIGVLREELRR